MKHIATFSLFAVLGLCVGHAAAFEPAFGVNCLGCHSQMPFPTIEVIEYDKMADPDESQTGAPDRGLLKAFEANRGGTKALKARIIGLSTHDRYAVEITRMRFPGVEGNGVLRYVGDCEWPEYGDGPTFFSNPIISYQWGSDPSTFAFNIDIDANADEDYYDLILAVAGRLVGSWELFYWEEHFYLQVKTGKPGDMNCDDNVDFADINPFVQALTDRNGYENAFPDCNWLNADCNSDGKVDFNDINAFIDLLTR